MAGTHKCPQCGRMFATAAAMQQHRAAKHGKGPKTGPAKKNRAKSKAESMGVAPLGGATYFQPISVRQTEDDHSVHFGVDRLAHIEDVSKYTSGSSVFSIEITAGSFSRLSVLAEAYQQVRYLQLDFRIASYASANVGGGYVAGFVKDPDDRAPTTSNARLNWLTAQPGSVTTRWPQQATVKANVSDKWFYTSQGVEVREYSPGSFHLVVDSKATVAAALTIWAHWKVAFRKATLEPSSVRTLTAAKDLYTQNGHLGLFWKQGTTFKDDNDSMFPGWRTGMSLRLPSPMTVAVTAGGSTTTRVVWWLKFTGANDCVFCYEDPSQGTSETSASEVLFLRAGTSLEIEAESQAAGEALALPLSKSVGGQSDCSGKLTLSSSSARGDLSELVSSLSSVCQNFQTLLQALAPSPSTGFLPLTVFPPSQSGSAATPRRRFSLPENQRESGPSSMTSSYSVVDAHDEP